MRRPGLPPQPKSAGWDPENAHKCLLETAGGLVRCDWRASEGLEPPTF